MFTKHHMQFCDAAECNNAGKNLRQCKWILHKCMVPCCISCRLALQNLVFVVSHYGRRFARCLQNEICVNSGHHYKTYYFGALPQIGAALLHGRCATKASTFCNDAEVHFAELIRLVLLRDSMQTCM